MPRKQTRTAAKKQQRLERLYPKVTLENALQVPLALKEKNGGNPWPPEEVANAIGLSKATNSFFYPASAARAFGLTEGGRDSKQIALTDFGRSLVYAPSRQVEDELKREAFLKVDIFRRVSEHYKGGELPELRYLSNTLEKEFGLPREFHEEFTKLFRENCTYLKIGPGFSTQRQLTDQTGDGASGKVGASAHIVTLAEPEQHSDLQCFVIMPFRERTATFHAGFFDEVLRSLIAPAGRKAGFVVTTASREGTEVIQSTIVNDLLNADMVIADLTEHNPNVLFELGMRMAYDKPICLIRAKGTGPIFDVDNMLRVYEYDPNLWSSTIERDIPELVTHIKATWRNKDTENSYMKLLRRTAANSSNAEKAL